MVSHCARLVARGLGVGVVAALLSGLPVSGAQAFVDGGAGSSTLLSGQVLAAGQSLVSPTGGYSLDMQGDCNLVLYRVSDSSAKWNSGTPGKGSGCWTVMQTDGNLVLYSGANVPLWNSSTDGSKGSKLAVQDDGNLVIYHEQQPVWDWSDRYLADDFWAPAVLHTNEWVYSDDHSYRLNMQGDCNLVLYKVSDSSAKWNSGTPGKGSDCWAQMQGDGNLVVYKNASDPTAVWNAGTPGKPGAYLHIGNDGTLTVMYNGSTAWTSGSAPTQAQWASPVPSTAVMTARYGAYRNGSPHYGTDYSGFTGQFKSACKGTVSKISINATYANRNAEGITGSTNYLWIDCGGGLTMGYAHWYANNKPAWIALGASVSAGQELINVGNQGNSSGTHVHFEVRNNGATIDGHDFLVSRGVQGLPKKANY